MKLSSVPVHKLLKAVHHADFDDSVLLIAFGSDEKDKTLADILKINKYFNFSDGFEGLIQTLLTFTNKNQEGFPPKPDFFDTIIFKYLNDLKIPPIIRGYYYLYEAVFYKIKHLREFVFMTKEVYPYIAKKYNTTVAIVEKDIRKAIHISWKNYKGTLFDELFGDLDGERPTSTLFIFTLAEKITEDLQKYVFK